jgi:hypothetical protein
MTPEQRRALELLRKEYHIIFSREIPPANWPQGHKNVFEAIRKLGQVKYSEYVADEGPETSSAHPWKLRAKILAKKLTEKAEQCLRRNEASWRFACEPLVFTRFSAEVAW